MGTTLLKIISKVPDCEAVAVVRYPRSLPRVLGLCEAIVATEGRTDLLADAFSMCDAVIDVSVGPASEIPASALQIAQSCQKAGVKRLAYTSSASAQSVKRTPFSLNRPPTYYGRQKLRAEETLHGRLMETELAVIRPGLIWGPRSSWTIRHVTEMASAAVTAPSSDSKDVSAPNLAFSENLAAKMLGWALSEAVGGSYYFADPWWSSWEDYFLSLAAALEIPRSAVVVARKLRSGPPSKLLFEFLSNHPEVARRSKTVFTSLPEQAVEGLKAILRPPTPPPVPRPDTLVVSDSSKPTVVDTGRFKPSDVDVLCRWAEPTPQLGDSPCSLWVNKEEALHTTVSWLSSSGHLDYLGITRQNS
jgi:hypothetical protein